VILEPGVVTMSFWRTWAARAATWPTWGHHGVGDEASAFLRGELLEQLLAAGSCWKLPAWVWLNTAAHASPDRLVAVVETARPYGSFGPVREWGEARIAVVQELLDRAGTDPAALGYLQREVLVRLEQDVSAVPDLTPDRLVEIAAAEMRLIGT
jgi:hypothetical protein